MISFSDEEFALVQKIAAGLLPQHRTAFVEKTAAYMRLHGNYDDNAPDVIEFATDRALRDIVQSAAELQPKTAREIYLEEIARNSNWHEAPSTGQAFGIGGARPIITKGEST
jgi:hypothetical protein